MGHAKSFMELHEAQLAEPATAPSPEHQIAALKIHACMHPCQLRASPPARLTLLQPFAPASMTTTTSNPSTPVRAVMASHDARAPRITAW